MTGRFDELAGGEGLSPDERQRLEHTHDLLETAGPPAELTPALERPPVLPGPVPVPLPVEPQPREPARTPKRGFRFRRVGLAAAAAVAAACLALGYVVGDRLGDSIDTERVVAMAGGGGSGELRISVPDGAGNRTLELSVEGLPVHPERGYYGLFLEDEGEPGLPCGGFRVFEGTTTLSFTVPYSIEDDDRWVVTTIVPGEIRWPGEIVMTTTA